jgi:hypothetical protein
MRRVDLRIQAPSPMRVDPEEAASKTRARKYLALVGFSGDGSVTRRHTGVFLYQAGDTEDVP